MEAIIRCYMCCSIGSERELGLPARYSLWSSCLFKNLREIATVLRKKINRKRLLFNLFGRNTLFAMLPTGFEESLIHQLCAMAKKKYKGSGCCCSDCLTAQKYRERTKRRNGRGLLPLFCQQRTTCICWLPEKRKTSLFSEDGGRLLERIIPKHHLRTRIVHCNWATRSCIIIDECHAV